MSSQLPDISGRLRGQWTFNKWEVSEILRGIDGDVKATSAEILRMQSEIVALRMKREELEKLREDCQSLMAPIRKLPTELLDHIFEFCCCDVASFFSTKGSDLVDAPAFTLSSVCAQWREIIRPNPKFWANLSLKLNPSVEDAYDIQIPVGQHLLLSKQYPLTLKIIMQRAQSNGPDGNIVHEHHLLRTLVQHSHRWISVSFICFRFFERLWPSLLSLGQLTHLKDLEIFQTSPKLDTLPHLYLVQDAPSLHSLTINCVPKKSAKLSGNFPWTQITHLRLRPGNGSAFRALEFCPNLQSVCYSLRSYDASRRTTANAVVDQISDLRSLYVFVPDNTNKACYNMLDLLLSSLTLPLLEVLSLQNSYSMKFNDLSPRRLFAEWPERSLTGTFGGEWPRQAFDTFIDRSGCTLTTLHLEAIPMSDSDAIHLLECLPSLQNLLITEDADGGRTISSKFLKSLHASLPAPALSLHRTSKARPNLPELKQLALSLWNKDCLDEQALISMLVSRWIPDTVRRKEIGLECLQTFCLHIGSGLISKETHRELEYLRHAGLFIRTVEDDEDKGDSKNDDDDDDSEDDDDSDSDLE